MPPLTMYQLRPDLYAYNSTTHKHQLKSGKVYKKAYAADPSIFTDSTVMLHPPVPTLELPEVKTQTVEPIAAAVKVEPVARVESRLEPTKHEGAREQVKQIIQAEIKENPKSYAGKSKPELDSMFRALLIERLSASAPPSKTKSPDVNKSIKPVKPATKPKKQVFKLRPPPMSDMEDESESEESD